ncbi:MAG: MBL fold metallo-hydrolase [DPANN group archaeon]|nr:MBL fold metallo-hydrolase [DPANN group archaeon]
MIEHVTYYGHDAFRLKGTKIIYIDPFHLPEGVEPADLILITHDHFDHFSVKDVMMISNEGTTLVCTPDGQSKLSDFPGDVVLVEPNRRYEVDGIPVETVPAYNADERFHPKDNDWVGYIISLDGRRYYHAGDTDHIPEMETIEDIDVAFLPVSGTSVMDVQQAVKAAEEIKPKIAVPMHYGDIVGNRDQAEQFKERYSGRTEILEPSR